MTAEEEKRLHRCCFSGHRPEKLDLPEEAVKKWLSAQIEDAIAAGYRTFICGMGMGVDIWAGELVLERKALDASIHLICAVPWPGFSNRWSVDWQERYSRLLREADLAVPIAHHFKQDVFWRRSVWMLDHSNRMIAYYSGAPGNTREMVGYAKKQGLEVITNNPVYQEKTVSLRESGEAFSLAETVSSEVFRENLLRNIGLERVFGKDEYRPLSPDQVKGLEYILGLLTGRELELLDLRYREGMTQEECGRRFNFSHSRAGQVEQATLRKLRHPHRIVFVRDGFEKTELGLKIACAEEMKRCLEEQKKRYPLMNEEDVVKFAFQGMLGVGHLIDSEGKALEWLKKEMDALEADPEEPLVEKISTDWVRLNLRAAKARGKTAEELVYPLCCSAKMKPLSFTRQNVYNFCVKLDGSEAMKAAAVKVLDEGWLPRHSEKYREAYAPAYRVMYKDFRKFRQGE